MELALVLAAVALAGVSLYFVMRVAQRLGLIDLRARGGATSGLAEIGKYVDPPTSYVVEAKQQKPPLLNPGDPPGPPAG